MISLHCGTMAESASKLKTYLESRGMIVWVCMEMSGGESYRDSIVDALDRAEVIAILFQYFDIHACDIYLREVFGVT